MPLQRKWVPPTMASDWLELDFDYEADKVGRAYITWTNYHDGVRSRAKPRDVDTERPLTLKNFATLTTLRQNPFLEDLADLVEEQGIPKALAVSVANSK